VRHSGRKCQPGNGPIVQAPSGARTESDPKETTMGQTTLTLHRGFNERRQHPEASDIGLEGARTHEALADRRGRFSPARTEAAVGEQVSNDMECFSTDDPELILKARQLMARVYLQRDFVTRSEITEEGVLREDSDPYGSHSTYYVVVPKGQKSVLATVRIINYDPQKGESSFPVMKYRESFDARAREILASVDSANLVEVSALARDKHLAASGTAALMLYKRIFIDALYQHAHGKKSLIMACNPTLFKNFGLLFGESFIRLGPDLPYPGQPASPAILSTEEATVNIARVSRDKKNPYRGVQEGVVKYFGAGANADLLSDEILSALETYGYGELLDKMKANDWNDVAQREKRALRILKRGAIMGKLKELLKRYRPELLAIIGLIAYTVARTGVVAESIAPVTSAVDWRTFLGIELVTTAPYVWGIGDLARNANNDDYKTSRKMSAYALAGSAFVAPYAYLAAEGTLHSGQGAIVAGGLIAISIGPALLKQVTKQLKHRRTQLARPGPRPHTPTGKLHRPATAN
jgi:hypothetical protein